MNKKFLILCLGAGLFFTSCQTETLSEDTQTQDLSIAKEKTSNDLTSKFHEPDWLQGPSADFHEPDWLQTPGANFHEPDWIAGLAWFECGDKYTGDANLTVNKNNPGAYSTSADGEEGMLNLQNLNVGGDLSICGLLSVENTVNIHRAGQFYFAGEMVIGTEEEPADLVINNGGHLNFAGKIIVTGDLIVNRKGTIEIFGGEDEVLVVSGEVIISDEAKVEDHRDHTHNH